MKLLLKGAATHHYFLKCIVCQNMRCCSNSQNMICLSYLDRHVFHPSYNKSSDDKEIHFRIKSVEAEKLHFSSFRILFVV